MTILNKISLSILAITLSGTFATTTAAPALTLEQAKSAWQRGDYGSALPTLRAQADKDKKSESINLMTGVALIETGNPKAAVTYLERGGADAQIFLAQMDYDTYHFNDAADHLARYNELHAKYKKPQPKPYQTRYEELHKKVTLGQSMLDRVEAIAIIDSITVEKEAFFRHYRISEPSGRLADASVLPYGTKAVDYSPVYVSEDGDMMIWSQPDSIAGHDVLVTTHRLADNTWEAPRSLGDNLNDGGNAAFPFLMSDGMTLYFGQNGENSLGGYDIFITRNDGEEYLQPQNIGMPYNSFYDDYMLAIDELTGAGWWATDRNQLGDKLTIYVFVPEELRINRAVDDPNLIGYALVNNIVATQKPDVDYSAIRQAISDIRTADAASRSEFTFAMPDGRIYTTISDFRNPEARSMFKKYMEETRRLAQMENHLALLREQYRRGNHDVADRILQQEVKVDDLRAQVANIRNLTIKSETNAN